jgi:branched-subunit amino acid permease
MDELQTFLCFDFPSSGRQSIAMNQQPSKRTQTSFLEGLLVSHGTMEMLSLIAFGHVLMVHGKKV